MKKAKEYLDEHTFPIDNRYGVHAVIYDEIQIEAIEIAFLEGQLKVIRDSEMCNAGERELQHRLKQLIDGE